MDIQAYSSAAPHHPHFGEVLQSQSAIDDADRNQLPPVSCGEDADASLWAALDRVHQAEIQLADAERRVEESGGWKVEDDLYEHPLTGPAVTAYKAALAEVYAMQPQTLAGLAAQAEIVVKHEREYISSLGDPVWPALEGVLGRIRRFVIVESDGGEDAELWRAIRECRDAMDAYNNASAAFQAHCTSHPEDSKLAGEARFMDEPYNALTRAQRALYAINPKTLAGLAALAGAILEYEKGHIGEDITDTAVKTFLESVQRLGGDYGAPERPATVEEMAALDFEPWQKFKGQWRPGNNDDWCNLAIVARMAWAAMFRSKAELVDFVQTDDESYFQLLDSVQHALSELEENVRTMRAAQARLLAAGSADALT